MILNIQHSNVVKFVLLTLISTIQLELVNSVKLLILFFALLVTWLLVSTVQMVFNTILEILMFCVLTVFYYLVVNVPGVQMFRAWIAKTTLVFQPVVHVYVLVIVIKLQMGHALYVVTHFLFAKLVIQHHVFLALMDIM